MKFRFSSNGDGTYFLRYGDSVVAMCLDKQSVIYLRKQANSALQETVISEHPPTQDILSIFEHWLPS